MEHWNKSKWSETIISIALKSYDEASTIDEIWVMKHSTLIVWAIQDLFKIEKEVRTKNHDLYRYDDRLHDTLADVVRKNYSKWEPSKTTEKELKKILKTEENRFINRRFRNFLTKKTFKPWKI